MNHQNQGLIITLIIFIILTSILGVACYFLGQGYSETSQKLQDANSKLESADSTNRELNKNLDDLKARIGYPAPSTDAKTVLQGMDDDIKKAMGDATNIPASYKEALEAMSQNLAQKTEEIANYAKLCDEYKALADSEIAKSRQQKEEYDKQRAAADASYLAQKAEDKKNLDELTAKFNAQTQEVDKIKSDANAAIQEAKQETADANDVAKSIAEINVNLSSKLDQMNKADFEVADGTVLYVDQTSKLLRLDIGRLDGIQPLTTMNVYQSNAQDVGDAQPKGSIEVVRILDDHISEARIITDKMEDPVMPGDLVYTPLWSVGDTPMYALTYNLDINGDGISDLDTIINLIESSGSKVAAWFDDEGKLHGKITPDITRVITENEDLMDILAQKTTLSDEEKNAIREAQSKFLSEAKQNSVREIKLSEFLRRTGYKETALISKYQENQPTNEPKTPGALLPSVSTSPIAPIYLDNQKTPPTSAGVVSPVYTGQKSPAPVSPGKVSDYYFRKRSPNQ